MLDRYDRASGTLAQAGYTRVAACLKSETGKPQDVSKLLPKPVVSGP
jgi:hypothetical protein